MKILLCSAQGRQLAIVLQNVRIYIFVRSVREQADIVIRLLRVVIIGLYICKLVFLQSFCGSKRLKIRGGSVTVGYCHNVPHDYTMRSTLCWRQALQHNVDLLSQSRDVVGQVVVQTDCLFILLGKVHCIQGAIVIKKGLRVLVR